MKKNVLVYTVVYGLLIIGIGGAFMFGCFKGCNPAPIKAKLIVNNKDIIDNHVMIRRENKTTYVDFPFIEFIKILGMHVEWIDDITADIFYKDKKYVLKTPDKISLVEDGKNENLFVFDGGCQSYTLLDKELVLDDISIKMFMRRIGEPIDIKIDDEKSMVYIDEEADEIKRKDFTPAAAFTAGGEMVSATRWNTAAGCG